MPFNTRNIIIFLGLAAIFTSIYVFFIRGPVEDDANLVSSSSTTEGAPGVSSTGGQNPIAENFLSLLLNIKNIQLDDSIFSDPAFLSLRDSSIELIPDANAGRPNPFAQIGSDVTPVTPAPVTPSLPTPSTSTTPTTPATPTTPTTGSPTTPQ